MTVISKTIQEFNGLRYYLCGRYYQHKGKRLHRAVWESLNGAAPKGWHVHHKDHNRSNNEPWNLELLRKGEHLKYHANTEENKTAKRRHMLEVMIPKAAEFHQSERGKELHSRIGKIKKKRYPAVCMVCGKAFETAHQSRGKFCGLNCKARNFRRVRRENKKH